MDLIYTDTEGEEIGLIKDYSLDFEANVSTGNNTFEIQIPSNDYNIVEGCFVYEAGSEIGGIVSKAKIDTAKKIKTLTGNTWRGVLEQKVIEPSMGSTVYTVSGDANEILAELIQKLDLEDKFIASQESSGLTIESYQFSAYTNAGEGILTLLSREGYKLKLTFKEAEKKVELAAVPINDYSQNEELSSEQFDFVIQSNVPEYNHIIAISDNENIQGIVRHRYLTEDGEVSDVQSYTGTDERVLIYRESSAETEEEFIEKAEEELLKYSTSAGVNVTSYDLDADIGDKFLATEESTGISVIEYVTKKIVTANKNLVKIQYEVGETIL